MDNGIIRCVLPVFGQGVAPRYDVAALFQVFDVDQGQITPGRALNTSGLDSEARLAMLLGADAEVLLCGGIRRFDLFRLRAEGIRVFPGLRGPVETVVKAFANGELEPWVPGWKRRRGRGRGGYGRHNRNR